MKKIFPFLLFCLASLYTWGNENTALKFLEVDSTCSVSIGIDSSNTGDVLLVAYPTGTAPFTYEWNTGATTSAIIVTNWGINYCVTVTDAEGCSASDCVFNQNTCTVNISDVPLGTFTAQPSGIAPYTYLWSNGSTSQSIQPSSNGTYCVTATDAIGCTATSCWWWGNQADSCGVYIAYDTIGSGGFYTAIANGTPPFSYTWQPGGNTQSIPLDPAYFGEYCVTVTDANGCVAEDCIPDSTSCIVWILEEDSAGMTGLFAIASVPFGTPSYSWSNGSTDDVIFPATSGVYCVTVTGGGCTSNSCYYVQVFNNMQINGYIYHPDSLNASPLDGTVELFFKDPTTNIWGLVGTTPIVHNGNDWYEFGNQTNPGQYIVKVTLDPSSPYFGDFLPTYHYSSVLWDEADIITIPSSGWGIYTILLDDGQNFAGGGGTIGGTVTEGDGLTANEEGDRGGAPRPNTSVVLFDNLEAPVAQTLTDEMGRYSFGNLPFGTYKLVVDVVGKELTEKWVTLTANNASVSDINFEVTETGVVLLSGINELINATTLTAFPNPTNGQLKLMFSAIANFEGTVKLNRLDGTTVLVENQQVAMGNQIIDLDISQIPSGLYLVQLTTDKGVVTTKIVKE